MRTTRVSYWQGYLAIDEAGQQLYVQSDAAAAAAAATSQRIDTLVKNTGPDYDGREYNADQKQVVRQLLGMADWGRRRRLDFKTVKKQHRSSGNWGSSTECEWLTFLSSNLEIPVMQGCCPLYLIPKAIVVKT